MNDVFVILSLFAYCSMLCVPRLCFGLVLKKAPNWLFHKIKEIQVAGVKV